MTRPIPVTVLGGYLGAGKTTLVNQLLRQADGVRIAVLVNEFGALAIDEDLIDARDDALISIAGGCICCSFGSDLTAALLEMAEMKPRPDHIVVESSGVAMPDAIAQSIALLPDQMIEGICVLVDCLTVRSQARDEYIGDTITRQIDAADLVVLTKTDLAADETKHVTETWLRQKWPAKTVIEAPNGKAPNAVILGNLSIGSPSPRAARHADDQYVSMVIQPTEPCNIAALAEALTDPALGVIRAKGYLDDTSGKRGLIQIAGSRCDVTFPENPGAPGVVCIGITQRFDAEGIRRIGTAVGAKAEVLP